MKAKAGKRPMGPDTGPGEGEVDLTRTRCLAEGRPGGGPVIYWMSRDQRARDNWALLYAREIAVRRSVPLMVAFCLVPGFLGATQRQYAFMLSGLREVEEDLSELDVPFSLLMGDPGVEIPRLVEGRDASALVTDFDPLRVKVSWKGEVAKRVRAPFYEVDAHNLIPSWQASNKQEYAAYTFRPKVHRALPRYMTKFPDLGHNPHPLASDRDNDWQGAVSFLDADRSVSEVDWLTPGEKAGREVLSAFLKKKLEDYPHVRNDPSVNGLSNLSPYLHFGQISAQRVALLVSGAQAGEEAKEAFQEELIVRRELSDNFCLYNPLYDEVGGFPAWAKETLDMHRADHREHLYTYGKLEGAETHDDLWNAAQREMVDRGKMHGHMRMYWAKKILEWTRSPEEALDVALRLNDRYELDGRDPNGYVGVAWSVGGVHDRAWGERQVFGKIRYMSLKSQKRKFDYGEYIRQHPALQGRRRSEK